MTVSPFPFFNKTKMTKIENIALETNLIPRPDAGEGKYEIVLYYRKDGERIPTLDYPTGYIVRPVPQFVQRKE